MEIYFTIKASIISLVVLVALLNTRVASSPVYHEQADASLSSKLSSLKKCLESLNPAELDRRPSPGVYRDSAMSEKVGSPTPVSNECKALLEDIIAAASSNNEESQQLVDTPLSSPSSSASTGSAPAQNGNREEDTAELPVKSYEGEKLPPQQPLYRHSRDVSSANREMLLRADGVVSSMLEGRAFSDSAQESGNTRGISDDALLVKIAGHRILAQLRKDFLRNNGKLSISSLIKPISQDPTVALRPAVVSKVKHEDNGDLVNALTIDSDLDQEDTSYSRLPPSVETSNFPSRGRKRSSNTLSINNAMMAITNMLLAEQKERLQRNRQRIRQHMLIQG
ncbi:hypothetical protein ElyMa_005277500 [Elysia marginata]|uniref:Corticotropin-releasing factor domain-containing protein n=1 Tax=Elysia marginata TaxID=1093978 RepID=A0AAV4JZ11_9GAST|nr:hypothetical protein ElyMa_005277500 [Elysia marginata]